MTTANHGSADALDRILRALGIDRAVLARRGLPRHPEARRLVPVGVGPDGRDRFLAPGAARAWLAMRNAAHGDGVELQLISGFRSVEFQAALIRARLERGHDLDDVLRVNAPPGFSEHHSGRALDIGTPGCAALDEAFESTPAFAWLSRHASRFGLRMSYPRENRHGYVYEPWHWYWRGG